MIAVAPKLQLPCPLEGGGGNARAWRAKLLSYVAILPWVQVPHLASHILSLVLQRLRQDWQSKYARPLHLVETFVDTSGFQGSCYRAANWLYLGQTSGRTRQDRWSRISVPPKGVLVYPLHKNFRRDLRR